MVLVADEGVDRNVVARLRADGHEVYYVAEMEPGISDEVVLGVARDRSAVLVTSDKDFGELVFRQGRVARGVLDGAFVVVDKTGVRTHIPVGGVACLMLKCDEDVHVQQRAHQTCCSSRSRFTNSSLTHPPR